MNYIAPSSRTVRLLLAAALVFCGAGGSAAAATFTIGGSLSVVYSFDGSGPPDGQNVQDFFNQTSNTQSVSDTALFSYTSDPAQITQSGRVDARASVGSVGVSGNTAYALSVPRHVNSDGYNTVQAVGSAAATFNDVIVTGPGSGNVSTRLRLHLGGFLSADSALSGNGDPEPDGVVGSANISFGISINGSLVGFGNLTRTTINGGSPEINASGLFAGFDGLGVVTTNSFLVLLNTPVTVKLEMQMSLQSNLQDTAQGAASSSAQFYNSLGFATDRPVFELPAGYTANSPTGGIVGNSYIPEPGTAALLLLTAPVTLLRRQRRA